MYNVHKQMALECKTMLCDDGETLQKPEMTLSGPGFGEVANSVTIQVCPMDTVHVWPELRRKILQWGFKKIVFVFVFVFACVFVFVSVKMMSGRIQEVDFTEGVCITSLLR